MSIPRKRSRLFVDAQVQGWLVQQLSGELNSVARRMDLLRDESS